MKLSDNVEMGNLSRGAFIVLNGIDRSGKTTQSKHLEDRLKAQGITAQLVRFPDRITETGQQITTYLEGKLDLGEVEAHLLFVQNRWKEKSWLEDTLKAGQVLIVDRYSHSGIAYSSAQGLDLDWCKAQEQELPMPDLMTN